MSAYSAEGLLVETWGGVSPGHETEALRHGERVYDADYHAWVTEESIASSRAGEPPAELTVRATWQTGLGGLESLTDFDGQTSHVVYDRLGRQRALYRPLCEEPSIVYDYVLDPSLGLHYARTRSNEVCDRPGAPSPGEEPEADLDGSTGLLEAYAFVDGLGR
ncbi:MAG: hypothetical protein ACOY3Y_08150, partial [Acidobacteriota bacterium]